MNKRTTTTTTTTTARTYDSNNNNNNNSQGKNKGEKIFMNNKESDKGRMRWK